MKKKIYNIIIKFIILIQVMSLFSLFYVDVIGYTKTGHEDFIKLDKPEYIKSLSELNNDEISKMMKSVKWKFFGWSNTYLHETYPINYDGKIVFARSNKTDQPITIAYSLREVEVTTRSVKVSGSVSAKVTGKLKKINLDGTLNGEYTSEKTNTNQSTREEKTEFKVCLNPNSKLTIITTGKGYLTTCFSKNYLFGIVIQKGEWERIDVETVYFELREEKCL